MNIYQINDLVKNFKPTRLYIKKLAEVYYFGKTSVHDIDNYHGSGRVWRDKIKKYGKENIKTLWVSEWYHDPYEISEVALRFSKENDIVNSALWANLKEENGLDGGDPGPNGRAKISAKLTGNLPWNKGLKLPDEKYKVSGRKNKGKLCGDKNHLYGRSIIQEKNLRWYTNGETDLYLTEGTEPSGYYRGRSFTNRFNGGKKTDLKKGSCVSPSGEKFNTVCDAASHYNITPQAILERIRRYNKTAKKKPGWDWTSS
jgi:hypothetical protein